MSICELVEFYEEGGITEHELAVEAILMVDETNVANIIDALPREVMPEVEQFVKTYKPNEMVSVFGESPSPKSVDLVRKHLAM